jgi:hypothetical protein
MATRKKAKKAKKAEEKLYSFDEYRKTFGTTVASDPDDPDVSPRAFGIKLAEEALKRARGEGQEKRTAKVRM